MICCAVSGKGQSPGKCCTQRGLLPKREASSPAMDHRRFACDLTAKSTDYFVSVSKCRKAAAIRVALFSCAQCSLTQLARVKASAGQVYTLYPTACVFLFR